MAADGTYLGRVVRIDCVYGNSCELCLVFDKASEFVECPPVEAVSARLASRVTPLADAIEVFDGDCMSGVFGG